MTFALLGYHGKQRRPFQFEQIFESRQEMLKVVSVDRPNIAEAQFLEENSRKNEPLGQFLGPVGEPCQVVADPRDRFEQMLGFLPNMGDELAREGAIQID